MEPITAEKGGFFTLQIVVAERFTVLFLRASVLYRSANIRISTNGPSVSLSEPRFCQLFIGQLLKRFAVPFRLANVCLLEYRFFLRSN